MTVSADRRTGEVLRRLQLDVERRLDGLLHGDHHGLVPGLGREPGESRRYQRGDDVRHMDWNVTARMGTPHVRDTIADRELETTVLADRSPSLDFGTARQRKADLVFAVTSAVGLLTQRSGNRFGTVITHADGIDVSPARTGHRHLLSLLHRLAAASSAPTGAHRRESRPTTFVDGLRRLAGPAHRPGLTVVVSDLLRPGWDDALRAVCHRHETIVVEVVDRRELELPAVGIIELRDRATGAVTEVDTRRRTVRERYAEAGRDRLADHAVRVRAAGADHLVLRTDRDWLIDLARFVERRRRGRTARGVRRLSR